MPIKAPIPILIKLCNIFMMSNIFDVIVIGNGLVAKIFAHDLSNQKPQLKIALIDKVTTASISQQIYSNDPNNNFINSRIYAITPDNVAYLHSLNVWHDTSHNEIKHIIINSFDSKQLTFDFNRSTGVNFLAKTMLVDVVNNNVTQLINNKENIATIFDDIESIEHLTTHQVLISSKRQQYYTKLLIGADGVNSFVRKQANIQNTMIDYHQHGIIANFTCELSHKNTAYQWFFANGDILAFLPLSTKQISIVYSATNAQSLLNMTDIAFTQLIQTLSNNQLGLMQLISKIQSFPLKMYLLNELYSKNIALIGDAAHTIHPLAGQGINLGFADARCLVNLLAQAKSYQLANSAILSKYNYLRIFQIKQTQYFCHMVKYMFNDSNIINKPRQIVLNIINNFTPIKNFINPLR